MFRFLSMIVIMRSGTIAATLTLKGPRIPNSGRLMTRKMLATPKAQIALGQILAALFDGDDDDIDVQ